MRDMVNRLTPGVTRGAGIAELIERMSNPFGTSAAARALRASGLGTFPTSALQAALDAHGRPTNATLKALERLNGSGNGLWPGQRLIEQMNRLSTMGNLSVLDNTAATRVLRRMEQIAALGATGGAPIPAWLRSPDFTGLPRSAERWLQGTPVAAAAQLWNEQLQQQDVSPEATPEEKATAATAAGFATFDALAQIIGQTLEEQRAAFDAQNNRLDHLVEQVGSLHTRMDAAELDERRWLLKPKELFYILLALFALINTPEVMDYYVPRLMSAAVSVQHLAQQVTESSQQWLAHHQDAMPELYEIGARPVPFHVRPHGPSRVTRRAAPGQTAVVVGRRGKWVKVAVYDPRAGDLVTGWCLKKYLHRPKAR